MYKPSKELVAKALCSLFFRWVQLPIVVAEYGYSATLMVFRSMQIIGFQSRYLEKDSEVK